ncbi:MAG: hypothetical protein K2L99_09115, partial [Muribaculaceae bacterium]|nr:hypothetical protein [Muribaculaceae bacterium]
LSAAACIEGFDEARVNELVGRIAALQVNGLSHCTFAFDKTPADFASPRAFNAARRAYNRAAFNKLAEDTRAEVNAILKEMNSMLPQSVRDAVKAQA